MTGALSALAEGAFKADGRQERFQAPRKFNPFNGQWEWDTSGC